MRTLRLLSATLAALLLGCQTTSGGSAGDFPNNNPTATSAELATGG
ncbi:hypothetical protein [Massilia sp. Leaf139]|nr:hypothetical protein [Massilia sp. Leaf139]